MGSDKFLSTTEVAAMVGRTRHTIVLWCKAGKIKAKKFYGQWYIYKDELFDQLNDVFFSEDGGQ